jgi:phosphoglycolate phosphatase-like HAD superfamily hydrolase
MLNKYDFFFFDFDGVIVDTVELKADAFEELFKEYGDDVARKVRKHHLTHGGMSRYEKFKFYYKKFLRREITESDTRSLNHKFSGLVVEKVIKAPFIPGVIDFLDMCMEAGKDCFVVSATPEEELKHIVQAKGLSGYFKEIVGSPEKKDKNLACLLKKNEIDRDRAVFLGDAVNDLMAAQENGIHFVGINYFDGTRGYRDFVELIAKNIER